ncbi:MAG: hypothetical protein RDV48_12195 [Candidatus Eremiobacteraeota bacterium]|nr:hypothetical protein [Candidatus Eremiobacteraeota bacterium]
MVCYKCKLDNLPGQTYCEACGTNLSEPPPAAEAPAAPAAENSHHFEEIKTQLRETFKVDSEEVKKHLQDLRKNLKLGKADIASWYRKLLADIREGRIKVIPKNKARFAINEGGNIVTWIVFRMMPPSPSRIVEFFKSYWGLATMLSLGYFQSLKEDETERQYEELMLHDQENLPETKE